MSFLRNPLAWYKHYVEKVHDMPTGPAGVVGRAGHVALQHFYGGIAKEGAVDLGLMYLRGVPDFEINLGKNVNTPEEKKKKRALMEEDYLQAISFYLARPPKYEVIAVEHKAMAKVEGLALPIKAVSDLVVRSKGSPRSLDVVDHKFVDSFSSLGADKTLFMIQAIFNYYTVKQEFGKPVRRFILHECKKRKNKDGSPQMRRYEIDFKEREDEFDVFHRLINDATQQLAQTKVFLPNPSDMFEGENSFDIYRLGL